MANNSLNHLLKVMYPHQTLYHQTLLPHSPIQKALLEDYAFLIDALWCGYERSYNTHYLELAQILATEAIDKFYKKKKWYLSDDSIGVIANFDDRYYTSSLSVMLEDLLCLSSLTDNIHYKQIVDDTLKRSGLTLEIDPTSSSKLIDVYLRRNNGNIVIHASKEKLIQAQVDMNKIDYPFVLGVVDETSDSYVACKSTMCFAYDKNSTRLIEKINKAIQ